ncbi:hypothetical protein C4D60_Mb11t06100 [Musa balbisiana]|uniref:RRM domain-containing protein n=1 Tax=Musa balbisiana TaxID=52838 RepID=A0A4S8J283_MUSBA|nr:hypothetical protein C4D60_Mb11t06100 [Musa balbisiana]
MAVVATAAATTDAASSSLLKLSLLRFPNRLLSSSSLRLPSFHHFASVPLSVSDCHHPLSPLTPLPSFHRAKKALAVDGAEENAAVTTVVDEKLDDGADDGVPEEVKAPVRRPCELYVCNLPRSCDIPQLLDLFKPYGTVHSVEDHGGRELRVKFSADMSSRRKNMEALNTTPKRNMVFESPHKVYVGNLAWSVRPEDLREYFSRFGNVVSTRVLYDRKGGRNRVYGFLSFTSSDELRAALETSGSVVLLVFNGRTLVVREVINR